MTLSIEEMKSNVVYNYGLESQQTIEFFTYCEENRGKVDFDPKSVYDKLMKE